MCAASNAETWRAILAEISRNDSRIEKMIGEERPPFFDFLHKTLEDDAQTGKAGPLSAAFLKAGLIVAAIGNPEYLNHDQAISLARVASRLDDRLDGKLLAAAAECSHNWPHDASRARLMRALKVIDAISNCQRVVIPLTRFLQLPNRHLRSKAIKLLARASRNPGWAEGLLSDPDPRVRSNLVEGIAEQLGARSEPLLRKAMADPHHRVSVTALLALCRLGDQQSRDRLERLAAEGDEMYRRAAAWALQQLSQDATATNPSTTAPHPSA